MKIENLRSEERGNRARVAATVSWEDCDRSTQEVFFETDNAFADSLSCNPNAFLISCAIPAMYYGEKRVYIDAEVCPELREGLKVAISWFFHWYYPGKDPIKIESQTQTSIPLPRPPERAGFFFTGGVDSMATLRTNRIHFHPDHPWSIKDGLLAFGLENDCPEAFDLVKNSLAELAEKVGVTLIPVYTNIYLAYRQEDAANKWFFWIYQFQAAALAAISHAFARRLTVVSIAGTYDIANVGPYGTHPLIDPNYSSADLRVRYDGIALSRLAKTELIADWDPALEHLRTCNRYDQYSAMSLNCGQCEKCLRTQLELLVVGALSKTSAFPAEDVSGELVRDKLVIHEPYGVSCLQDLIGPLSEKGRYDLVSAIEYRIHKYHKPDPYWKAKIKYIDEQYLNGKIKSLVSQKMKS